MENDQQITVKINDDETIRILGSFGRENLCGVYLLGISCLARIYGLSKPQEEYAFFNSKEELKKFIQTYLNNECGEILVDPKDGAYLCSIGESPTYLFVSALHFNSNRRHLFRCTRSFYTKYPKFFTLFKLKSHYSVRLIL